MTRHAAHASRGTQKVRVRVRLTEMPERVDSMCQLECPVTGRPNTLARCSRCAVHVAIGRDEHGTFVLCAAPERTPTEPPSAGVGSTPVRDVMAQTVICVSPDLPALDVARLLVAHHISGVPVVDPEGTPLGIVSKSDLLRDLDAAQKAADVMTPLALGIDEGATIGRAAALMAYEGVHRLLVLSTDGRIVGIVSSLDVMRWLARASGWVVPTPRAHER